MSAPPTKYVKSFDYAASPTLNTDFDRLVVTTGQTIDRLAEIQRDDGKLKDGAITTNSLADGSVTEPKLATGAVSTRALADGSVTGVKLAAGSIPPAAILPNSIGSAQLADGGIATVDLADGCVTLAKLGPDSVDSSKIVPASIAPSDLSPAVFSAFAPAVHTHPESDVVNLIADLALKAPLASPALTGVPTAPTPATGTNTTQLATTAFVAASMSAAGAITEAPNDGALYGRQALGWQLGVKQAGDVMTGPLQVPLLRLGGATNLFAGLKSSAAELQARLADDSGFAAVKTADHAPGANILSSLGTAALRWLKLWAKDGDFSGDVNITGQLTAGTIVPASLAAVPNKNIVQNGDFKIDQRQGYTLIQPVNATFIADRWQYFCTQLAKLQTQNINSLTSIAAGQAISTYLAVTSLGVYNSSGADQFDFSHYVEGYDLTEFLWGSAAAKPVTLSLWVYSSVVGPYSVCLRNVGATHSYLTTYTVNVANTWEKKTITIPGPTVGTWGLGSNAALCLDFTLDASGASLAAPGGGWTAAVYHAAVGQTKWLNSAGAVFAITGIKLELGNVATPFVALSQQQSLEVCQRYYWNDSTIRNYPCFMDGGGADYPLANVTFPVAMRAQPSMSAINIGTITYNNGSGGVSYTPAGGTPQTLTSLVGGHYRLATISNPPGAAHAGKGALWGLQLQASADP